MRKSIAVLILSCLLLTACGGRQETRSFYEEAAGIPEDAILLTVDGREIPAWRYLYWLACTCDYLQERYREEGVTLDWSAPLEGGTLADYAKDQALANTALYAAVESLAEESDVALAEADRAALAAAWEEKAAEYGGEDLYLAALAQLGLSRGQAEELAGTGRLYAKLYANYMAGEGPLSPPEEPGEGPLTVDRILIRADGDRETAREQAAEVFARLNEAADKEAVFPALAAEGDDPAGPRPAADGGLAPSLAEAAALLAPGQCSGILESDEGFSILLRCEASPENAASEYFDVLLQAAAEAAPVETTEAYRTLDAEVFAAGLRRARKNMEA